MFGTRFDGELDRLAGVAGHAGHGGGSLVYRVAPSRTAHGGLLLFYRQQHTVVSLGWHAQAWALIVLQLVLCLMNLRGWRKNKRFKESAFREGSGRR